MRIGAFGQAFHAGNVIFASLLAMGLAGCGADGARFVGSVSASQGACGVGFDAQGKATATLMLSGESVQFVPTDGVTTLGGKMNGAGHIVAGSNMAGADKKPFPQVFEGDRNGDRISGVFATPRCRASVELRRG